MANSIRLIVGLGNPGPEYTQTRHNAGVWFIDELTRHYQATLQATPKFFGYSTRLNIVNEDVRLIVPTTFMNLSGQAIAAIANFYRIEPEQILVAHDEMDLSPGVARLKKGGGHGGHNGLKDTIAKLGNNRDFYRLRIGIGHPGDKSQVTGYVLGKPPKTQQQQIEDAIDEAVRCLDILFKDGLVKAQNRLHNFQANP
ncbi:aminoacyl-tRNA hydrolase [Celerinatantimonas yamalensis]|uniref:Peptidyl-tRNA hydrolase n=1 Tax=Celerinatantimonas yamalensis TaxID=559956 RepID=A0ABW9G6G4_9GAMM